MYASRSSLADNSETIDQVLRQADSVLDDVAAAVVGAGDQAGERRAFQLSSEIGTSRATHRVHPMESLHAAAVMFEVLLPVVTDVLRARQADDKALQTGAVILHDSILHRVGLGAVSYASFLLKKVTDSHRDERHRVARELHDGAAHAVGVALQDLELHDVYADLDPPRARQRIGSARTAMREALDVIRHLAQDLRESAVEVGGLARALSDYLTSRVASHIVTRLSVTGADDLPDETCNELYFVLREAIRNAVLHAQAQTLEVVVNVENNKVDAMVRDDGQGFDVAEALVSTAGIGLYSMQERLDLLDGTLDIVSTPGDGTVISIHIDGSEPEP